MNNKPLVSIIVPIFKVKKEYVVYCLDSIRQQTYPNIEVWLIDDGNEEDYASWLDTFTCENVFVHHQRNKGVSAARNVGIELAKGEYVCFCDPDDIMHVREVEILMNHAQDHNADIAVGAYQEFKASNLPDIFSNVDVGETLLYQEEKDIQNIMLELVAFGRECILHGKKLSGKYAVCYPWGHIYKRESLCNIRFIENMHPNEDNLFNIFILKNAKKIVFVDAKVHYYRIGYGITARFQNGARENNARFYEETKCFLLQNKWEVDISNELQKAKMREIASNIRAYFFHPRNPNPKHVIMKELIEYVKQDTCIETLRQITNPYYTRKQRMLCAFLLLYIRIDKIIAS